MVVTQPVRKGASGELSVLWFNCSVGVPISTWIANPCPCPQGTAYWETRKVAVEATRGKFPLKKWFAMVDWMFSVRKSRHPKYHRYCIRGLGSVRNWIADVNARDYLYDPKPGSPDSRLPV